MSANSWSLQMFFSSLPLAVMKAIDETRILTFYVALQFKNSSDRKDYVLTGNAEGQDITSTVSSSFKFKNSLRGQFTLSTHMILPPHRRTLQFP